MKVLARLCGAAAIALMMAGCNQAPSNTHDADVKAINSTEAQWNADYAAKDLGKVVGHYADDGVLMTPGAPPANGKDAIRTALQPMISDPAMSLTFKADRVDVAKSGDLGYTQGSYNMTLTDPVTHKVINDHGSYVTTYRKQADGSWKALADIAVSSAPPAAPPKPAGKHHVVEKKRHGRHK